MSLVPCIKKEGKKEKKRKRKKKGRKFESISPLKLIYHTQLANNITDK